MGTTLDNGIYLPDEGERNCYDGLAGNWVALDNHLGSTDIHVTINDKQAWDGHVADPNYKGDAQTKGIRDFNEYVQSDERVENIILALRDGLSIIYKK